MEISVGSVRDSRQDAEPALVLRVADCNVTYQQDGTIKTMGYFEFRDAFVAHERMNDGAVPVKVKLEDL